MTLPTRVLVFVLAAALLSGCTTPQANLPPTSNSSQAEDRSRVGATGPTDPGPGGSTSTHPPSPPHRWEGDFKATLLLPGPCPTDPAGCGSAFVEATWPLLRPDVDPAGAAYRNATGYHLALTWNATTEAAKTVRFRLVDEASGMTVASARGQSPLHLEIPKDALAPGRAYVARPSPDAAGAFVQQAIRVTLELR